MFQILLMSEFAACHYTVVPYVCIGYSCAMVRQVISLLGIGIDLESTAIHLK